MCLADIGVRSITREELLEVARKACIPEESIHSMPFPVTPEAVAAAITVADQLGQAFKKGKV
ncbi:Glycerol dehydrogenase [compost metagenome]